MRGPRERSADLRAQLAAGAAGAARFGELADRFGIETVREGMRETLDYAERLTRARIAEMPDGEYRASDWLEARSVESARDAGDSAAESRGLELQPTATGGDHS